MSLPLKLFLFSLPLWMLMGLGALQVGVPAATVPVMMLSGLATLIVAFELFPKGEREEVQARLGLAGVEADEESPLLGLLRPLFLLLLPMVGWVGAKRYREKVDRGFVTSGMTGMLTSNEFFAFKLVMTVGFYALFVLLFFRGLMGWAAPWWIQLTVILLGFYYPDMWLNSASKQRKDNIRRALPYVMDLLTLSVEAGLDFVQGVGKVCEKARRSPLIEELDFFLGEIRLGASRQQGLRALAWRVEMPEMRSFSALLIQADILGASVGPVLRAQSDLIRTQRFQRAERQGAYASQKILFPLILCIMPAVFVVIFGPIALNFLYGDPVIGP
jgi:tight adherence protein C